MLRGVSYISTNLYGCRYKHCFLAGLLSCDLRRGQQRRPERITGAWPSERGPGAFLCCLRFCLSLQYHYLPTAQINPFNPSQSHSATDCHSYWFSVKIFGRRPPLLGKGRGGAEKKLFHRNLSALSAALIVYFAYVNSTYNSTLYIGWCWHEFQFSLSISTDNTLQKHIQGYS